jgi:hypothetical protein
MDALMGWELGIASQVLDGARPILQPPPHNIDRELRVVRMGITCQNLSG